MFASSVKAPVHRSLSKWRIGVSRQSASAFVRYFTTAARTSWPSRHEVGPHRQGVADLALDRMAAAVQLRVDRLDQDAVGVLHRQRSTRSGFARSKAWAWRSSSRSWATAGRRAASRQRRGEPAEVERHQAPEQVVAMEDPEAIGQQHVEDDPRPQLGGEHELVGGEVAERVEVGEGRGGERLLPDRLEVAQPLAERPDHPRLAGRRDLARRECRRAVQDGRRGESRARARPPPGSRRGRRRRRRPRS